MPRAKVGEWPERPSTAEGHRLLDDHPTAAPRVEDLFQQHRVTAELISVIDSFVSDMADRPRPSGSLFLALHGRHGQGKSNVVACVEEQIDASMVVGKGKSVPVRVKHFNCSHYQPDDLLFNFDQFIEQHQWLRLVAFSAVVGIVIFVTGNTLAQLPGLEFLDQKQAALAVGAFLVFALASMRHVVRDCWRMLRIGRPLIEVLSTLVDRLVVRADVLIVDDLDRASPEQQAAFLKSLNRHRRDFTGVVLIVFDDGPLLDLLHTRANAAEFMSKVFDASYRLAPMNARDAGRLAAALTLSLRANNESSVAAIRLAGPTLCGDLARVFVLHGNSSARFAKKLVNNVFVAAQLGGFQTEADISALIRLHGLFEYLPALETELDLVAQSLLDGSEDAILAYIDERFEGLSSVVFRKQLTRFLHQTRHMQPANFGWMRQLRIWRGAAARTEPGNTTNWPELWTTYWAMNDAYLATLSSGEQRLRAYSTLGRFPCIPVGALELQADAPQTREDAELLPQSVDREIWQSLVDRHHFFDDEGLSLESDREIEALIDRHRARPAGVLSFSRTGQNAFSNARTAFRHSLFTEDSLFGDRLSRELQVLAGNAGVGRISLLPDLSPRILDAGPHVLDDAWPDFAHGANPGELTSAVEWHFEALGQILPDFPREAEVLPNAHRLWFKRAIEHGHHEESMRAIGLLMQRSRGETLMNWPSGTLRVLWEQFPGLGLEGYLARQASPPWNNMVALWAISLHGDLGREIVPLVANERLIEGILPEGPVGAPSPWFDDLSLLSPQWPVLGDLLSRWEKEWGLLND